MATYSGRATRVAQPAQAIYERIADVGAYQKRIDSLPEEARAKLGEVKFTDDAIHIHAQPVGEICFKVTERRPCELVRLEAEQSPVPFIIDITVTPDPASPGSASLVSTTLNVDIPAMLKPMVGGRLQEAADKFSDLITQLFA